MKPTPLILELNARTGDPSPISQRHLGHWKRNGKIGTVSHVPRSTEFLRANIADRTAQPAQNGAFVPEERLEGMRRQREL
ncbi:hypothetical protein MTO96_013956 [Rhipicephalus appendiculatus]